MRYHAPALLLALVLLLAGCKTPGGRGGDVDLSLRQKTTLYEMLRYAYLWHFDGSYAFGTDRRGDIELWIREVEVDLDVGDQSRFAEVWVPRVRMLIHLKKADYAIPELGLEARDSTFKIQTITRELEAPASRKHYMVMTFPRDEALTYLENTSEVRLYPDETLLANLEKALLERRAQDASPVEEPQIYHVAPISPVSNELWVYQETRGELLRFSADIDLYNPAYWRVTPVHLEIYDLRRDVLVSPDEAPGSNAYLTKDFTGRVLFNCVVFGKREEASVEETNAFIERAREAAASE